MELFRILQLCIAGNKYINQFRKPIKNKLIAKFLFWYIIIKNPFHFMLLTKGSSWDSVYTERLAHATTCLTWLWCGLYSEILQAETSHHIMNEKYASKSFNVGTSLILQLWSHLQCRNKYQIAPSLRHKMPGVHNVPYSQHGIGEYSVFSTLITHTTRITMRPGLISQIHIIVAYSEEFIFIWYS